MEELGSDIVEEMPGLIDLQNTVISLPSINSFIKSNKYYPLGDRAYVDQVITSIRQRVPYFRSTITNNLSISVIFLQNSPGEHRTSQSSMMYFLRINMTEYSSICRGIW